MKQLMIICLIGVIGLWAAEAGAQSVELANPSFEAAEEGGIAGWTANDEAVGRSDAEATDGEHALRLAGNPDKTVWCTSMPVELEPLAMYALRYDAKVTPHEGGPAITGPMFSNHILYNIEEDTWEDITQYFQVPSGLSEEFSRVRLGHARMEGGQVLYDDVELYRVHPMHTRLGEIELGIGESVEGNTYRSVPAWDTSKLNVSRNLIDYRNSVYNYDTFLMGDGSSIMMKHEVGERAQTSAMVNVSPRYYFDGALIVEVGVDGETWQELGRITSEQDLLSELPAELFPTQTVWVRMRVEAEEPVGWDLDLGSVGITAYRYESEFDGEAVPYTEGTTDFVGVPVEEPTVDVEVAGVGEAVPEGKNVLTLDVEYKGSEPLETNAVVESSLGDESMRTIHDLRLEVGENRLEIPYALLGMGQNTVEVNVGETPLATLRYRPYVAAVFDADYGRRLPDSSDAVSLWWASSGYKVSKGRPAPELNDTSLKLSAARNEIEAAQFVVRPAEDLTGFQAVAKDLKSPSGAMIPAHAIDLLEVGYVYIHTPTDLYGAVGYWPDPLPKLDEPITLEAGENQPIWVRVNVPNDVPAGTYEGAIELTADGDYTANVPVTLEVYDFTLPDRMTVETAFGLGMGRVFQYQRPANEEQKTIITQKYLQAMAEHRISPYDPAPLTRFGVEWPDVKPREAIATETLEVKFDWTAWDAAVEYAMENYHFNTMRFSLPGLGSSGHNRESDQRVIHGFEQGTPEFEALFHSYASQFQNHLREKGWLDEAYIYWFDEPTEEDYEYVKGSFELIEEHAPGLRRMLTEQTEPELIGGPNLWCPMISHYQPELAAERQAAGDQYWWYVCTIPKEPYLGLFIDRPATDMRLWLWQTWQYDVSGVLIWETCYWTSPAAFPGTLQNPYEDPMGWNSSRRVKSAWGNGDGRLFYPPLEAADGSATGVLGEPVDTQRIEMLRDGIEDYEYFAMLERLIEEKGNRLSNSRRLQYEALLEVPEEVSVDRTNYTSRPEPIERHREKLAAAIASLRNL